VATRPIKIAIIGDDSQLKRTLKQASSDLQGFGKRVARVGVMAGAAFGASAVAIGTKGVTAFAGFEKGMKEVMTLLPGTGAEVFGQLSDQVKDFAKEFGVLPDDAIPALYQALSAGVAKDNVFEFMEVAQRAAKGGVTDLETAVDGITSVVNAYGVEVISATEASDLLFTAVKLGKTNFSQLSNEVYKVAPIAAAVGIPFNNLTAAIANLTAQGTPTAQAATQLKAAMAELAKEGTKADTAFRDLAGMGLQQFLEHEGNFESAILMMKEGADEAGTSVLDMFGSVEAGQAILALTADGGAAFSATMAEMSASAGATQTAFETMDTGLAATFDRIKANLSVMAIETGERLAPHVLAATDAIMDGYQRLQPHIERAREVIQEWVLDFAERLAPHVERFKEVLGRVIDRVRTFIQENPHPVLAALAVIIAAVVIPAVLGLVAAFFALFSPAVLIVAALAALAGGAVYAYEHFEQFRNVVDTVREWAVTVLWPALQMVAEKIVAAFWVMIEFFRNDFVPMVQGVVTNVVAAWQWTANFFMNYLWPSISTVLDDIVEAFWAVVHFFQEDFVPIVTTVVETITSIWTVLADFFMEYVYPIVQAAIEAVISVLGNFWDVIKATVALIKALFSGDFEEVWYKLRTLVGEVIQYIVDLFIVLPARILAASQELIQVFLKMVAMFTIYLADKLVDLILWIPEQIKEFLTGIAKDIYHLGRDIGSWIINGLIDMIKGAAAAVMSAVQSIMPDVGGMVQGAIGGIGGAIKGLIPGLAHGGIVTSPTLAVVGEAGPEAVIPLNKAGNLGSPVYNITVNAGMGTDGHQVGNQIVSALKQWERTNGSLPLTVSAA